MYQYIETENVLKLRIQDIGLFDWFYDHIKGNDSQMFKLMIHKLFHEIFDGSNEYRSTAY